MAKQAGRRINGNEYEIEAAMRHADVGTLELNVYRKGRESFPAYMQGTVIIHDWAYAGKELPQENAELLFSEHVDFFGGTLCRQRDAEQGMKPQEPQRKPTGGMPRETAAGQISYEEMLELVFAYLRRRGVKYVDTWVYGEETEWCEREMGFQFVERDNSGWEPKYFYTRKLE